MGYTQLFSDLARCYSEVARLLVDASIKSSELTQQLSLLNAPNIGRGI